LLSAGVTGADGREADALCILELCVMGIWLLELIGFGWSLEHPTVIEQTISSAANTSTPMFFPQATESRVESMLRITLVRVTVSPPAV
jgi:hypothetical protein